MKSLKTILAAALCAFGLAMVPLHAAPINEQCPVSGKVVDKSKTVDVPVTFCCGNCKAKFDKAPGDYLEKVAAAEEGKCPLSGKDVDKAKTSTVTIGVCCGNCEKKVKADPKAYIGKVTAKKE